jgi:hypothetical protein
MASTAPSKTKPIPALLAGAAVGGLFGDARRMDMGAVLMIPAIIAGGGIAGRLTGKSFLLGLLGAAAGTYLATKVIGPMRDKAAAASQQTHVQDLLQEGRSKIASGGQVHLKVINGISVAIQTAPYSPSNVNIGMFAATEMVSPERMLQAVRQATGVQTVATSQVVIDP